MPDYFDHKSQRIEVVADGDAGPVARFVMARIGEDAGLVTLAHSREHPGCEPGAVVAFSGGLPPRPELCSRASVAAALPGIASMIDAMNAGPDAPRTKTLRDEWAALCERFGVAFHKELRIK